jgi:dUTP pyrophosphatase
MKFKKLHPDAQLPTRQTDGAAGYDLHALESGYVTNLTVFRTGVAVEIPRRHVGLIMDRSGLAVKKGVTHLAGVIDDDYRGEIHVAHTCVLDEYDPYIEAGDRIAQLVVVPCVMEDSEWVEELSSTDRGDGKFGSTGK